MAIYKKINPTTFRLAGSQPLDIVVGDEKQKAFATEVTEITEGKSKEERV